uniref:UNC-45/Cro1/She4 central domain-containing protein n=1 Tax=Panagrolaimus sp. JU765 TaxID=591449 RepID=A0AC34R7E1_9BILA
MPDVQSAEDLKDLGNDAFKNGDNQQAIQFYNEALQLDPDQKLRLILYKNRAQVKLKMEDYEGAEDDCSKVLEVNGADSKALYRRALAREQLDKIGAAFQDAKEASRLEPKNLIIQKLCENLMKVNGERLKQVDSTENKVKEMFKLAFENKDHERKSKALSNLLVLARESEEGAKRIWQNGKILEVLLELAKNPETSEEFAVSALRIIDELMKKRARAMVMVDFLSIPDIARLLAIRPSSKPMIDAAFTIIQRIFNALAAMDRSKEIKPDPEVAEKNKIPIIKLILELEEMMTDPKYNAVIRESIVDLFCKNLMHMDGGLPRGWSWRFTEDRGLLKLLHLASQIPEVCDYPVSAETRQHVAICLARLYDDMVFDTRRAIYREKVDQYFGTLMTHIGEPEYKIKLVAFLITMLQGPVDIGMNLVTNDDVTATMLNMASSDDHLSQSLAAELIVQTASKHERATKLLSIGLPVLRKLYESTDHSVKVRALMGLCKIASAGGDDAARATMKEEEVLKLADTCKLFLLSIDKYSVDIRRFACEGLSYLSLDADVKEWIVADPALLQALVTLAKSAGALCVYTLAHIYVNLTNSYDKPKVDEELVKLAQFAKHHVPEVHLKDTDDYVDKRIRRLVKDKAVTACVAVSKTESKSALDLLARCMNAFCGIDDLGGQIISDGGSKLLLTLYEECTADGKIKAASGLARLGKMADPNECTADGKIKAASGLARLGKMADPNVAFPGQRMYEVVKAMVELLHPDIEGLANYDALMTLTNLASVSDSVRKQILKKRAVPKIEEYWYMTEHKDLRAAAAETLLNLLFLDEFYEDTVKPGTDRLKLWFLYSAEDDERLQLASSAGFALLTKDETACKRILEEVKSWTEVMKEIAMAENPEVQRRALMGIANMVESDEKEIAMAENPEVQRRALMGIANMVESDEKVASQIIATDIFRVLIAITKLNNKERIGGQQEAERALKAAEEKWKIIKATDRQLFEKKTKISTVTEITEVAEESENDSE